MRYYILSLTFTFLINMALKSQPPGTLDPSFGNGGKVITSVFNGSDKAYGVAIQSDGKILVAGTTTSSVTGKDFVLLRYLTDGSLDNSFGNNGMVSSDLQLGSEDIAYDIALQADGKIILAGSSDDGNDRNAALARYNSDGSLDSDFGVNGVSLVDLDENKQDEFRCVTIHTLTGKILAGGSALVSTNVSKPAVVRFTDEGEIDTTFNSTGIKLLWVTSLDYQYLYSVEDLKVLPNGKITAIGWRDFPSLQWDADYWACKINTNGTMDVSFSTDGVNVYNGGFNGNDKAFAMHLRQNNNFVLAGGGSIDGIYYNFSVFEVNADGSVESWANASEFGELNDDIAYGLVEDLDGKMVLAGSTGPVSNNTVKSFALFRVNLNSSTDSTFGNDGQVTTTFGTNTLNECFDVSIQSDNKIVAVGYTGDDIAIARYLGTGIPQLDEFTLVSPNNNAGNQQFSSLTLNWTDAYGATDYEIEVATENGFSNPQTYTSTASTKTISNLTPATQYFWRVKALAGASEGNYSEVWSFTTSDLSFSLTSPANNAINQYPESILLNWSNATGASTYDIELATDAAISTNVQTFTSTQSEFTVNNLQPLTDYFWRVRAEAASYTGNWTNVWKFTTGEPGSIQDAEKQSFHVSPNPADVYIEVNDVGKQVYYQITSLEGKLVRQGKLESGKTTLSVEHLSPGTYFLLPEGYAPTKFEVVR